MEKSKKTPEERLEILDIIKTQSSRSFITHHSKKVIYIVLETICYLLVASLIITGYFFPDEIIFFWIGQKNPTEAGENISKDLQLISSGLKILILIIALFPISIALLLRKLRKKNNLIKSIHDLAKKE
jgi:hypothetical protein